MHISLDSELGRQRRLNQVGETISSIAAPTAAYSLRSLTGGDPKVVRVRRGSDNHEQDFTASDVSSGALQDFVNAQVTAPLDIRALTATGRDGDFLIAKAAYSLRSLGTRQATVAATGDTVARADGKFVAQVRRNVDGNLKSFTATEVTDGTLLSFVNESFTSSLPLDVQGSAAAAYSLRNLSSSYSGNVVEVRNVAGDTQNFKASEITDGTLVDFVLGNTKSLLNNRAYFDKSNDEVVLSSEITMSGDFSIQYSFVVTETGGRILGRTTTYYIAAIGSSEISSFVAQIGSVNKTLALTSNLKFGEANTIKFKRVSGKIGIYNESDTLISNEVTASGDFVVNSFGRARGQYAKGVIYNIRIDTNNDGTINHSYNGYGNTLSDWTDLVGSNNASAVNGSPALFTGQDQDGFVKTWYDQSGNSNNAVQGTAASQPKIVSAGALNTSGGLEFDATDDFFALTSTVSFENLPLAMFSVQDSQDNHNHHTLGCNNSRGVGVSENTINYFFTSSSATLTFSSSVTGLNLYTAIHDGTTNSDNITGHRNGVANSSSSGSGFGEANTTSAWKNIGVRSNTNDFFEGTIKEIIVYNTDQTDNRRAIEESISGHYGITLGSFNRDGFVKTWYDQSVSDQAGSATGNHATQATAGSQPKIVSAGSLVTVGVDFTDGKLMTFTSISAKTVVGVNQLTDTTNFNYLVGRNTGDGGVRTSSSNGLFIGADTATSGSADFNHAGGSTHVNGSQSSFLSTSKNVYFGTATSGFALTSLSTAFSSSGVLRAWRGKIAEIIIYDTDQSDNRTAIEANIGEVYSIDLPSGVDPGFDQVDGFVETWYDQSGNGKDATQATAGQQPKIVNAGSLLTAVTFYGSDDNMDTSHVLGATSTIFGVCQSSAASDFLLDMRDGGTDGVFIRSAANDSFEVRYNSTDLVGASGASGLKLGSFLIKDGTQEIRVNGTSVGSATTSGTISVTATTQIGGRSFATPLSGLWLGSMSEIIIYNSDESANRPALETNIINHYGIS